MKQKSNNLDIYKITALIETKFVENIEWFLMNSSVMNLL